MTAHSIVDSPSVDAHPLDSAHYDLSAHNTECGCGRPDDCNAARINADTVALPDARQLIKLLIDALPGPLPARSA